MMAVDRNNSDLLTFNEMRVIDMVEKNVFQDFETICQQRGIRLTHQRLEIFRELTRRDDHPSAEEIYSQVHRRLPSISLDTVYRTLDTFAQSGIVSKFPAPDGRARFDSNLSAHHHLVCSVCNRVEDFYWPEFDALVAPDGITGWGSPEIRRAEIRGICSKCRAKGRTPAKK
jgi:Fur family peroxide stress response transcriptional regulator